MISVNQNLLEVTLTESPCQVTVQEQVLPVTLTQEPCQIIVQQNFPQITIQGTTIMPTILQFSVRATVNGQTVFTIPYAFTTIICLFIMGTGQDQIAGDYTISGSTITLGSSAPTMQVGDLLFGAGQI